MNRSTETPADPRTCPQRRSPRLPASAYVTRKTVHVNWSTHRKQRIFIRPPLAALTFGFMAAHPETLAVCIMPDHVHWLVDTERLTEAVKSAKSITTLLIQRYGRRGKVWQRSFHDRVLRSRDDRRQVARYLVANPVRSGLVREAGRYPWAVVWWNRFGD